MICYHNYTNKGWSSMFSIIIKTKNSEYKHTYDKKILLSDALENAGIYHDKPCGGKGTCKKCKVIANGETVLACITYIDTDTVVDYSVDLNDIQGVVFSKTIQQEMNPLLNSGYGLAVDIGTTTLAGYIYKFPEGECVKSVGLPNPQKAHGSDVISRIEFAGNGGQDILKKEMFQQIKHLSEGYKISKYIITGNTVMLHFITGLDASGIAKAPFSPKSLFGKWYDNIYYPRCISSYVGADITTAIIASGMMNDGVSFLVDVGTNGEMVINNNGKILCCSTAAGPAFEGANISSGMLSVSGAINKVYIEDGNIHYTTIDNATPVGICGTGLIDAVACMLELGIIDETGYLEDDFEIGNSGIYISPSDIRQLQLAKSAIRAGIDTLLHKSSISCRELESFYIAGGFGSFINKESAAAIGLIPKEVLDKVEVIGNGAGAGACMLLLNSDLIKETERLATTAETIELSSDEFFMNSYMENMMFYK